MSRFSIEIFSSSGDDVSNHVRTDDDGDGGVFSFPVFWTSRR